MDRGRNVLRCTSVHSLRELTKYAQLSRQAQRNFVSVGPVTVLVCPVNESNARSDNFRHRSTDTAERNSECSLNLRLNGLVGQERCRLPFLEFNFERSEANNCHSFSHRCQAHYRSERCSTQRRATTDNGNGLLLLQSVVQLGVYISPTLCVNAKRADR